MLVVGIDPGTRQLGWGIVRRDGSRLVHVAHGVTHTAASEPLAQRMCQIESSLVAILQRYRPSVSSVETLFFHRDAQAAAKLGHARGVVLLVLARAGLPVFEYQPAKVKRTVTGRGQAEKRQVALMVRALLSLERPPPSDAADALALAITHLRIGTLPTAVGARLQAGVRPRGRR